MSGGFSNPIIGGSGSLVYPAIKSPNYVPGQGIGWSINKDGSASFSDIEVIASGGSIVLDPTLGAILIYED